MLSSRVRAGIVSLVAAGAVASASSAVAATESAGVGAPAPVQASAQTLQAAVQQQLLSTSGGTQISSNQVSYEGGRVIVTFPQPGQNSVAAKTAAGSVSPSSVGPGDVHGCPYGFSSENHWYCFWDGTSFTGRMLQFKDCNSTGYTNIFSTYNFQNQTSSWVNTRNSGYVRVYQGSSTWLWTEGNNSELWAVAPGNNDMADRSVCTT